MYHLTRLSLAHPRAALLLLALVTTALAAGLPRLRTEFGYRVLIGDDHPSIRALDRFVTRFGGGLPVQIAWECGEGRPCETVFDRHSLEMAYKVAQELALLAGIQTVRGPANAALLVPAAGGFAVRRFVENGELAPDAEALAVRAVRDPFWVDTLVSADATVGVILVQPSDTKSATDIQVVDAIGQVLGPFEQQGFAFHLLGDAAENVIGGRDLAQSSAKLIPIAVLAIALALFTLSRSWLTVGVALGSMGVALIWTFGFLGWLDWPRDGILEILAPL